MADNVNPNPGSASNDAAQPTAPTKTEGNLDQLIRECRAMLAHGLDAGLKIPSKTFNTIETVLTHPDWDFKVQSLVTAHNRLSELVKPATPTSITFLAQEREKPKTLPWFLPKSVSIARSMAIIGVTSMIVFCIVLALVAWLDPDQLTVGSRFWYEFLQVIYPLVAASLGASFLALYQANTYIVARTFHPKFISSYYYRYVLGLMAGMILSNLSFLFDNQQNASSIAQAGTFALAFTKPVLAMIGGFSASVVYRILFRLVDAVESIVRGDTKDIIDAEMMKERARMNETAMGEKMKSTGELLEIRESLKATGNTMDAIERLDKLIESNLPPSED